MSAVLIPTSSEAGWLEARRQGITASEIAIVMGLSPYSSPFALYHAKRGELPEQADNIEMELGRYLENFVCRRFAERCREFWVGGDGRSLYTHEDRPWQLATPDRLLSEHILAVSDNARLDDGPPLAVLEAKTDASYDGWGDDGSDEIPVHYRCQVLWQMDVMGVTTGYVACLFLHSRQLRVYELAMDADALADLKIMRDTAQCFLDDIRDGNEPDVDWRPATTGALKHLHPSVEDTDVPVRRMPEIQYRAALKAYKAAEQRKKLAENRMRQLLGSGHRLVSAITGDVIATRQVYDLAAKTIERKACTVDKLVAAKPKKEPSA